MPEFRKTEFRTHHRPNSDYTPDYAALEEAQLVASAPTNPDYSMEALFPNGVTAYRPKTQEAPVSAETQKDLGERALSKALGWGELSEEHIVDVPNDPGALVVPQDRAGQA